MKNNPTAPSGHVGSSDLFGLWWEKNGAIENFGLSYREVAERAWIAATESVAGKPYRGPRECKSWMGHKWKTSHSLNSGFYHHGALARTGEVCERCAAVRFPETHEQYFAKLPEWLKNDSDLLRPNT